MFADSSFVHDLPCNSLTFRTVDNRMKQTYLLDETQTFSADERLVEAMCSIGVGNLMKLTEMCIWCGMRYITVVLFVLQHTLNENTR